MKRILVTGAGGPATNSFVRSLRDADAPEMQEWGVKSYHIIGIDAGKYNVFRSEAHKTYLCPKATDEAYIPFINMIIERERIDFIHSQPEICLVNRPVPFSPCQIITAMNKTPAFLWLNLWPQQPLPALAQP